MMIASPNTTRGGWGCPSEIRLTRSAVGNEAGPPCKYQSVITYTRHGSIILVSDPLSFSEVII